ncbi:hypothetical protein ENU1_214590 [Entamoeba nuttalli P19]|uniref:Uncharacterized protein n=1 Tax=Entamoeba nuttalli (strain P19) TaxID=1076696 RepID=K2G3L3_ENTNP|nr:hypothetical protein ENU1_214590 [Entamoeba nuttalli P19]EKE36911.1 hypothetical protein ENU1_214590 [Entamoeba nuttalli P19]|eukprot:XP_008860744.1 hypothetical protein ENU1_214590 [Entamoeba nuttalli P19]
MENKSEIELNQNQRKSNILSLEGLLKKTVDTMVILLNSIDEEKTKYEECFGPLEEHMIINPPQRIIEWVHSIQQTVPPLEDELSPTKRNRIEGTMKMDVGGVIINFSNQREKHSTSLPKVADDSLLFFMNNQFKTKSIGITANISNTDLINFPSFSSQPFKKQLKKHYPKFQKEENKTVNKKTSKRERKMKININKKPKKLN